MCVCVHSHLCMECTSEWRIHTSAAFIEMKKKEWRWKKTALYDVPPNSATTACACVLIPEQCWLSADVLWGSGSVSAPITGISAWFGTLVPFYGLQCEKGGIQFFPANKKSFSLPADILTCDLSSAIELVWKFYLIFFEHIANTEQLWSVWQSGYETYRLRGFDKDLGATKLVLILVHVDRS